VDFEQALGAALIKTNSMKQTTEQRGIEVFFRDFPRLPWFQSGLISAAYIRVQV
jgi:hypothetical protein